MIMMILGEVCNFAAFGEWSVQNPRKDLRICPLDGNTDVVDYGGISFHRGYPCDTARCSECGKYDSRSH